jgi:hypothetical protein
MLVHVQYDTWDIYTYYKRYEDGEEQEALTEGTLDVERVPVWGKVRADGDLRLGERGVVETGRKIHGIERHVHASGEIVVIAS